jgi:uncharacterized protein (TIGR02246 family)
MRMRSIAGLSLSASRGGLSILHLLRRAAKTYIDSTPAAAADEINTGIAIMSIEQVLRAYESALNANDVASILDLYSAAPVFMPQGAPALMGRDAVRAGYDHVFDTLKLDVRFTVHEIEEVGDRAWARTSSAGRTRLLATGTEVDEGNNELFVFSREGGAWRIHRYLFATQLARG